MVMTTTVQSAAILLTIPAPKEFYRTLLAMRDRDDMHDVFVEIHEVEESDETMGPFSERVFVIARCDQATLAELFTPLQSSELEINPQLPSNTKSPPVGYTVYSAWWD